MRDLRVTQLLPIQQIRPAPDNVREQIGDVRGLANSIREEGLLTPLLVAEEGDRYILVAGHRRLAAMKSLGWTEIPCVVRPVMNDSDRMALMIIENAQRVGLNPIEKALAFKRMTDQGYTQSEVGKRVGVHQQTINMYLRLLILPPEVQDRIRSGHTSMRHGLTLARAQARSAGERRGRPAGRLPADRVEHRKTKTCDKCGGTGEIVVANHPHPDCPNCTANRLCFKHAREKAEADQQELERLRAQLALKKGPVSA